MLPAHPPPPLPRNLGFYRKHTSLSKVPSHPLPSPTAVVVSTVQTYYLWILMTFVNELQRLLEKGKKEKKKEAMEKEKKTSLYK